MSPSFDLQAPRPSRHEASVRTAAKGGGLMAGVQDAGVPLSPRVLEEVSPWFDHDLTRVRIHTDAKAQRSATEHESNAYTIGDHIIFGAGRFDPASEAGRSLLVHELVHIAQQGHGSASASPSMSHPADAGELEADGLAATVIAGHRQWSRPQGRPVRPVARAATVMRQARPGAAPAGPRAPLDMALEAARYLDGMGRYLETLRSIVRGAGGPVAPAERQRRHRILDQARISRLLAQARSTYEAQVGSLPAGDQRRTDLRRALQDVLEELRLAAAVALENSEGIDAQTRDQERVRYLENARDWLEASPTTSSGLLGSSLTAADEALGRSHVASIEAYLDDLIMRLPSANLGQRQKDAILERIQNGLRRAFVTVASGPAGTIDVRGITEQRVVDKYRRVTALLTANGSAAQLSVITDSLPAYVLPAPVPNQVVANADVSHVPAAERPSVLFGIDHASRVRFNAPSTVRLVNAVWPVVLQVRRGAATVGVRYDLFYDAAGRVRAERLGDARDRELPAAFTNLSLPDKKASIVRDLGLRSIDDRPAAPAQNRAAANWTSAELDQVRAALELLPVGDRASLAGVTIVRDHVGPAQPGGSILGGFAHTAASAAHDAPVPPPHGPPHIHYYDAAFAMNATGAVGAPGRAGLGGDWTVIHEVGHFRMFAATIVANDQIARANQQILQANPGIRILNGRLPPAMHPFRQAWSQARARAHQAILAFNRAAVGGQPPAALAPLLGAARAAVQARDQARQSMTANGVPGPMVAAASRIDAASDALLAASQAVTVAAQQVPIFVALAGRFGLDRFTDYARRESDDEWFAETYALFVTDPDLLNQKSRRMFQWFQAGMPMDANWNPPP
jgi:hypothetical protein